MSDTSGPRFHVGDIVQYDAPENYRGGAPREPFQIQEPPILDIAIYHYAYRGWYYPEHCLRLVEAAASDPVDVDIGELL